MGKEDKTLAKAGNRRERRAKEGKSASGVDNTFRRTWDKDEYEDKAAVREKVSNGVVSVVAWQPRDRRLSAVSCCATLLTVNVRQAEQDVEESALDIKRRKRLGAAC
jgi:hypothetical protein